MREILARWVAVQQSVEMDVSPERPVEWLPATALPRRSVRQLQWRAILRAAVTNGARAAADPAGAAEGRINYVTRLFPRDYGRDRVDPLRWAIREYVYRWPELTRGYTIHLQRGDVENPDGTWSAFLYLWATPVDQPGRQPETSPTARGNGLTDEHPEATPAASEQEPRRVERAKS